MYIAEKKSLNEVFSHNKIQRLFNCMRWINRKAMLVLLLEDLIPKMEYIDFSS